MDTIDVSVMSDEELKSLKESVASELKTRKELRKNSSESPTKLIDKKRIYNVLKNRKELYLTRYTFDPSDKYGKITLLDAMTGCIYIEADLDRIFMGNPTAVNANKISRAVNDSLNIVPNISYLCDIALSNYYICRAPRKGTIGRGDKTIKRRPGEKIPEDRIEDYKNMVNEMLDVFEKYANIATEKYKVLRIEKDWEEL